MFSIEENCVRVQNKFRGYFRLFYYGEVEFQFSNANSNNHFGRNLILPPTPAPQIITRLNFLHQTHLLHLSINRAKMHPVTCEATY